MSDDTRTQGYQKMQLELNSDDSVRSENIRQTQANFTYTYGLQETLDAAINFNYQVLKDPNAASNQGMGDSSAYIKWRFYKRGTWSFAVRPQLNLPTGNSNKSLGNGRLGYSAYMISTYSSMKYTVLTNTGITYNDNMIGVRNKLWNTSAAVLVDASSKAKFVIETGASRNTDYTVHQPALFCIAGLIFNPNNKFDIDVGYRKGLNRSDVNHSWGVGLTYHGT
ncbi:transporter [Undibacterium sp. Di27W]|uniref:transporter n=1 Tax=Undibacterium sp. Di27W TaxID=3413036 RepID=UPI003BF044AF